MKDTTELIHLKLIPDQNKLRKIRSAFENYP